MSDIIYLIGIDWPFLLIAIAIGIATGWYGTPDAAR